MNMFLPQRNCLSLGLLLLFRTALCGSDALLAVTNAGIEAQDNGARVPSDYQFFPGDPLFAVFEISGFQVKTDEEKDTRSISLTWDVSVLDSDDVPLAPPQSGEIKTGLSVEDRKWLPKRRAEFSLPQLIGAGTCHVHIVVRDLLGKTEAAKDLAFLIGGRKIDRSQTIGAQQIELARQAGGPDLQIPAYRPGDTIFVSFDITGFSQTPAHEYHVNYRFQVLSPDGKVFVNQPQPVDLSATSFYPAKFVPVNFSVITPAASAHGEYTIVLAIGDQVSGQSSVAKRTFTLE